MSSTLGFILLSSIASLVLSYHPIVNKLQNYIEANETFAALVNQTFIEGGTKSMTYEDMYIFFDSYITIAPNVSNNTYWNHLIHYIWYTPTGNQLASEPKSQAWFHSYLVNRRQFCDSINSSYIVPAWTSSPEINMSEYVIPSNGYQSFNQFFAREIKPGI